MEADLGKRIMKRLEFLCRERNMTVYDLGERCTVAATTIEKLMRGKTKRFSVSTMKKICSGLQISLSEFYDSDIFH